MFAHIRVAQYSVTRLYGSETPQNTIGSTLCTSVFKPMNVFWNINVSPEKYKKSRNECIFSCSETIVPRMDCWVLAKPIGTPDPTLQVAHIAPSRSCRHHLHLPLPSSPPRCHPRAPAPIADVGMVHFSTLNDVPDVASAKGCHAGDFRCQVDSLRREAVGH
jgi:hypothetical protein